MNFRSNASTLSLSLAVILLMSGCAQLNTAANSSINSLAKGVNRLTSTDTNQSISDKSSCDEYIAGKVLGTGLGVGVGATAGYYLGGKKGHY